MHVLFSEVNEPALIPTFWSQILMTSAELLALKLKQQFLSHPAIIQLVSIQITEFTPGYTAGFPIHYSIQ